MISGLSSWEKLLHLSSIISAKSLLLCKWGKAMVCQLHILVTVNLQNVASLLVDCEPSQHVSPVKLEFCNDLSAKGKIVSELGKPFLN